MLSLLPLLLQWLLLKPPAIVVNATIAFAAAPAAAAPAAAAAAESSGALLQCLVVGFVFVLLDRNRDNLRKAGTADLNPKP